MEAYRFRNTVIELYNIAGKTNLIALVVSIILMIFCVIREIDLALTDENGRAFLNFYQSYSPAIWSLLYCSIVYAFAVPLLRIRKIPYGKSLSNWGWSIITLLFICLIVIVTTRLNITSDDAGTIQVVATVIAVVVGITGWFVQHQITANTSRVNHTLNILLQTRISEVFENHTKCVNKIYPNKYFSVIPEQDVKNWHEINSNNSGESSQPAHNKKPRAELSSPTQNDLDQAITSQFYLLNYYEFLAVGVKTGLLDEELLYETIGGIVIRQVQRSEKLINHARHTSAKTFINLVQMEQRWKPRREFENKECQK